MSTLLLRLCGPMQSWGTQSRFTDRDTQMEPTKSGVIGLICAALGRDRSQNIEDLSSLKMGVRVDKEGLLKTDYHIAGKSWFLRASGTIEKNDAIPSKRHYISDADFLVGFETDNSELLEQIFVALQNPTWNLYLGRKAFVPSKPIYVPNGITSKSLVESLRDFEYFPDKKQFDEESVSLRFAIELNNRNYDLLEKAMMIKTVSDQPVSFVIRKFVNRDIAIFYDNVTNIQRG